MQSDHRPQQKTANPFVKRILIGAFVGEVMALFAMILCFTPPFQQIENVLLDWRYRTRPPRPPKTKMLVVAVDEQALNTHKNLSLGLWGPLWAETITTLDKLGATAIGMDSVQFLETKNNQPMQKAILQAKGKVVIANYLRTDDTGQVQSEEIVEGWKTAANGAAEDAGKPAAVGLINLDSDLEMDAVLRQQRYILPFTKEDGEPTFALLLALRSNPKVSVPTMLQRINYLGPPHTVPYLPIQRLWKPGAAQDPELKRQIEGAIVIIGYTDLGLKDFVMTPFGRMEGAEVHANLISTLLDDGPIQRGNWQLIYGIMLLVGIGVGVVVMALGATWTACLSALFIVCWEVAAWWIFARHNVIWPMLEPALSVAMAFAGTLVWRIVVSEREVNLLGSYVGPTVQGVLRQNPEALETEGSEYNLSVMFTDIRGFTRWSQDKHPTEVVALVNKVGSLQTQCVFDFEGTVDKFLGDGMMAFFGAPVEQADHARRAVRCALAMQAKLAEDDELKRIFPNLRVGIGIHSGRAVVGFLRPHDKKHEYTALGDTVNLASRLQDATKFFTDQDFIADLVVSETTYLAATSGGSDLALFSDYSIEGPREYKPHNRDAVTVYILGHSKHQPDKEGKHDAKSSLDSVGPVSRV